MRIHKQEVVGAMLDHLKVKKNKLFRSSFEILARLYHQEKYGTVNTGEVGRTPAVRITKW